MRLTPPSLGWVPWRCREGVFPKSRGRIYSLEVPRDPRLLSQVSQPHSHVRRTSPAQPCLQNTLRKGIFTSAMHSAAHISPPMRGHCCHYPYADCSLLRNFGEINNRPRKLKDKGCGSAVTGRHSTFKSHSSLPAGVAPRTMSEDGNCRECSLMQGLF